MKEALMRASRWIGRTPEEARRVGDPASAWAKGAIFAALIGALLALLVPGVSRELGRVAEASPDVPLDRGLWKAWYSDITDESACAPAPTAACPASPSSPLLWKSPERRGSPEH